MTAAPAPRRTGFAGVLPGRAGLVAEGLDDGLLQRWDRWFEMAASRGLPSVLDPARPAWRLAVRAGVFGPWPVFGVFRLGRDRLGRSYPFAVLAAGDPPDATDPWFDAAESVVRAATGDARLEAVARAVELLPEPGPPAAGLPPPGAAAVLWRDDWEVHEHRVATPADLAAFPLDLAAEADLGEEDAA